MAVRWPAARRGWGVFLITPVKCSIICWNYDQYFHFSSEASSFHSLPPLPAARCGRAGEKIGAGTHVFIRYVTKFRESFHNIRRRHKILLLIDLTYERSIMCFQQEADLVGAFSKSIIAKLPWQLDVSGAGAGKTLCLLSPCLRNVFVTQLEVVRSSSMCRPRSRAVNRTLRNSIVPLQKAPNRVFSLLGHVNTH